MLGKTLNMNSIVGGLVICFFLFSCEPDKMGEIHIYKSTKIGWDEKEPCKIKVLHGTDSVFLSGGIKCRGGSSSKYYKHSYALELDQAYDLFNVSKDDDWVLNASYIDKTFMRHKLCYDLFRQMGKNNEAPKSTFVQVTFNGKYDGIYVLKEKLTASRLGLEKTDKSARLYKGSYIFKKNLDWNSHDTSIIIHQKFPDAEIFDHSEDLIELRKFVLESTNEEFASNYHHHFDLKNIIDWNLLLLITNGGDGLIKNNYFYKTDKNTPYRFALWDSDHSLGRDGDGELNLLISTPNFGNNILISRLNSVKEINYENRMQKRYKELRDSKVFSLKNLLRMVDQMKVKLAPYVAKNAERWPLDAEWYSDDSSFDEEVGIIKQFIKLNLETVDNKFNYVHE